MNKSRRVPTTKILYLAVCVLFASWASVCLGESVYEQFSFMDHSVPKEGYQAAWEQAKAALDEAQRIHGTDSPETAAALRNFAMASHELGRFTEAEDLFKKSLDIRSKTAESDPLSYADSLLCLSDVSCDLGKFADAELLALQALGILENMTLRNPNIRIYPLYSLAYVYRTIGRLEDARTLAVRGKSRLNKDIHGGELLMSGFDQVLAALFFEDGEFGKAEELLLYVWETRKKEFGESHPDTVSAQIDLGYMYVEIGKSAQGEKLLRDALSIEEAALGRDYVIADILSKLGAAAAKRRDQSEAEVLFQRALQITENSFGSTDYRVGKILLSFASPAFARKDFTLAGSRLERAVAILENSPFAFQEDHIVALTHLGITYWMEGKTAKAEPFFIKVLNVLDEPNRMTYPDRPRILQALVEISTQLGKKDKAEEYKQRLMEIETDLERKRKAALEEASGTEKETNDSK